MRKVILIFCSVLFVCFSDSNAKVVDSRHGHFGKKSEAGYCTECANPESSESSYTSNFKAVRSTILHHISKLEASVIIWHSGWLPMCGEFASGPSYGNLGQTIINEIESREFEPLIEGASDLKKICPSYRNMDRNEKEGLWVVILAGMAFYESTCMPNPPPHRGPNGVLLGMMQLHKGKEHFYSKSCSKNDSARPESSITCAMAMLRKQIHNEDRLFSDKSYWEVLRPKARIGKAALIREAITKYPSCL